MTLGLVLSQFLKTVNRVSWYMKCHISLRICIAITTHESMHELIHASWINSFHATYHKKSPNELIHGSWESESAQLYLGCEGLLSWSRRSSCKARGGCRTQWGRRRGSRASLLSLSVIESVFFIQPSLAHAPFDEHLKQFMSGSAAAGQSRTPVGSD